MNSKLTQGTSNDTAVLLLGFGGPERFEDVPSFIQNVVVGRNVPQSRIDSVIDQYKQIGGRSPFNELTSKQAQALQTQLATTEHPLPVYTGMLYWAPYIKDVVKEITTCGAQRIIVIVMAVHRTEASYERYIKALTEALDEIESNHGRRPTVEIVGQWHLHPLYIEACADRVVSTLEKMTDRELESLRLIFTAHSVPQEMSDKSRYQDQMQATASAVANRVRGRTGGNIPWAVAYQSRSGQPNEPWIEPDLHHELAVCKKLGKTNVVLSPIGFVCDHVEVLFDLDILAARTASELGMRMLRAGTVGDHPSFIRLLSEVTTIKAESFYAKPER